MTGPCYHYIFNTDTDLGEARRTLDLALLAVGALVGEARLQLDVRYGVDDARQLICINADTAAGQRLNEVFVAYAMEEFGRDGFTVTRPDGDARSAA